MTAEQVPELLGACANTFPLHLDLSDLVSADAAGIEALQRLRRQGATLIGVPGYLQLKLDSAAAADPNAPLNARRTGRTRRKPS